ncbi:hypothetical protein Peur_046041 [Populus x canadensis]
MSYFFAEAKVVLSYTLHEKCDLRFLSRCDKATRPIQLILNRKCFLLIRPSHHSPSVRSQQVGRDHGEVSGRAELGLVDWET